LITLSKHTVFRIRSESDINITAWSSLSNETVELLGYSCFGVYKTSLTNVVSKKREDNLKAVKKFREVFETAKKEYEKFKSRDDDDDEYDYDEDDNYTY
jgi:hypothetical protein